MLHFSLVERILSPSSSGPMKACGCMVHFGLNMCSATDTGLVGPQRTDQLRLVDADSVAKYIMIHNVLGDQSTM